MIKKTILYLLLLGGIASCSTDTINTSDFEAGETFTDSNIRVMLLDTATVLTSTIKYDSILTSEASRIMVGQYSDSIFGTVKASSFMELIPQSYSIASEAVYDSIVLYLKYDGYFYADTLQSINMDVYELAESLNPGESGYFNTSEVSVKEEAIGNLTFNPRPSGGDSLEIKIKDSLGLEIFNRLQQKDIVNSDEFTNFFKGLQLKPASNDNGAVLGYSLSASLMRLYFSEAEETSQEQSSLDFTINTTSSPTPFFNRVLAQNPIDYLSGFTNQEDIRYSTDTNNQSYIQSGTGIATRIEFPHIKTLFEIQGEGTLLGAVLKIKPSFGSFNDQLALRDTLSVFVVDQNNDITEQLAIEDVATVQAILNRDGEEFNDIYYELPLSTYIESILMGERSLDDALILFPNNYISTIDRFVLNDSNNGIQSSTLQITYAIYDEDE
ncbi:DUF4270 family protein [Cytophaga sp. FL35]|uniref:DUF4270 family protein n=1 Tax=Cytophaga sp. FL35 TaxID=1904456 RepID=UPI001653CFD5|nr:DUF4270 family protein [Cytophaga sp. FL35]MBC6997212.1 DUF4270 family protein [Cytophaga sp. FL35]